MKAHTSALFAPARRRFGTTLAMTAVAACSVAAGLALPAAASSEGRVVPAYSGAAAPPAPNAASAETAVLAGGCFWGVQGVFQHVKGVSNAVSGYAGGEQRTASYDSVSRGGTGHAESVSITFDPRQISYARILQIYFSVAHDPTQLDRQGPDHGTQYRSAIFPMNAEQAATAKAYIAQLDQAHVFPAAIVTKIEPGRAFYPAEQYHQDFLFRNPTYPYIVYNDLPKIDDLKRVFPALYRAEPALTSAARKAA